MGPKDLKVLLKIMRDNGVLKYKTTELELELSPEGMFPSKKGQQQPSHTSEQNEIPSENPWADFPDGVLSNEQLAYYSAGGLPENDPYRKDQVDEGN